MAPVKTLLAMAVALSYTSATPISRSKTSPRALGLQKRYNTVVNCDAPLDQPDPVNDLNTQADFLNQASADMASLANWGFIELDTNGTDSPAFQHYFLPNDLDSAKLLFSAVAENNDPTNSPYDFVIDCGPDDDCTDDTYVLTESDPEDGGPRTMLICPAFWRAENANVTRLLPSDPYNQAQKDQWCESEHESKTNNYRRFVTAGHMLLHEITHLDKVGASLENDLDKAGGHGTFDFETLNGDTQPNDAWFQARELQLLYVQDPERTDTKDADGNRVTPIRNAESFAGCGTEAYFMMFCNVPYLSPETGVGPDDADDDPDDKPEWKLPDPTSR